MSAVVCWQVSQKTAACSAEQATHHISRYASPSQPVTASLQQQRPRACLEQPTSQPTIQHAVEDAESWRPQQAQHVQQDHQPQQPSSSSLRKNESGEDVGMAGVGRGFSSIGGAGVAPAMALNTSAAHASPSFPPQAKPCRSFSACPMISLSPLFAPPFPLVHYHSIATNHEHRPLLHSCSCFARTQDYKARVSVRRSCNLYLLLVDSAPANLGGWDM